jgi:hypothetical protein
LDGNLSIYCVIIFKLSPLFSWDNFLGITLDIWIKYKVAGPYLTTVILASKISSFSRISLFCEIQRKTWMYLKFFRKVAKLINFLKNRCIKIYVKGSSKIKVDRLQTYKFIEFSNIMDKIWLCKNFIKSTPKSRESWKSTTTN